MLQVVLTWARLSGNQEGYMVSISLLGIAVLQKLTLTSRLHSEFSSQHKERFKEDSNGYLSHWPANKCVSTHPGKYHDTSKAKQKKSPVPVSQIENARMSEARHLYAQQCGKVPYIEPVAHGASII